MRLHRIVALLLSAPVLTSCATGGGHIAAPANPSPGPSSAGPDLLVRLDVGYDGEPGPGAGRRTADYLSDGTVIRWTQRGATCQPGQPCGILERNALTAAGAAGLRELLRRDADLLAEPRVVVPEVALGNSVSARPDIIDTFVLAQPDGARFTVSAPSKASAAASAWVADSVIDRLNDLAGALLDPATFAGPGGLADTTWERYAPAKTAIFVALVEVASPVPPTPADFGNGIVVGPLDGNPVLPDIAQTGWPFDGAPDTFGGVFEPAGAKNLPPEWAYRCAFLPSADAGAAIANLPTQIGMSYGPGKLAAGETWESGVMRWGARSSTTGVVLMAVALLPEDVAVPCSWALMY